MKKLNRLVIVFLIVISSIFIYAVSAKKVKKVVIFQGEEYLTLVNLILKKA